MRCPFTFCWPTQAMICEMLRLLPLLPAVTVALMLLRSSSDRSALLPLCVRALLSTSFTFCSNICIMVRPGLSCRSPCCPFLTSSFTDALLSSITRTICSTVARSATVSAAPMVKPRISSQLLTSFCSPFMKRRVASCPKSLDTTWMRPPPLVPTVALSTMPCSSVPFSISTTRSLGTSGSSVSPLGHPLLLRTRFTLGRIMENACLPVHSASYRPGRRGSGTMMAGVGILPSQSSMNMHSVIICARVRNTSRLVIFCVPSSESCTIPITGLLDCGDTTLRGTIIRLATSALAVSVCGTCRFISSPSKSALYGAVTDRLRRKVE
mmetsp:Transcript_10070/g.31760  ORF Transcript_10070/g.31760 Transcript_10070/m.31760 type:complete len:324 (+) Transcript_10070:2609-3580(+)